MECFVCYSSNVKRNGYYKSCQKYKCNDCGKQFSERTFSFFYRHRFPEKVIMDATLLAFFVSSRNASFLLLEMIHIKVSHQSCYNWSKKFAKLVSKIKRQMNFSDIWHGDEKFIKVRGSKDPFAYLWVVIDDKNAIITEHVSFERNIINAKIVLKKAYERALKPPDIIVTDGLQAYKKACKMFGGKTKHVTAHFETKCVMHKGRIYYLSNNRIESLNSKINLWYKKFRGFKSLETARLFCEMYAYFYNYLRPRTIQHQTEKIKLTLRM